MGRINRLVVKCDEEDCDWATEINPDFLRVYHNEPCPRCNKGILITTTELWCFRIIKAVSLIDTLLLKLFPWVKTAILSIDMSPMRKGECPEMKIKEGGTDGSGKTVH